MSYCLNPDCSKPYNSDDSQFCLSCGQGLRLKDRYRAIEQIGQGGFGKTFLAVDEDKPSKPRCVIKQFFPQAQEADIVQKASELFEQEAIRLDELGKHLQIPELLAYITVEQQQYLVQEFIEGENLAKILTEEGAFNETQIQYLLICLLPLLEFIHSKNVIHRDIKPANIIRRLDGQFVLVDFGSAKFTQKTAFTVTGTIIGTSDYIAPEQAKGKGIFASDIYSLGVTCLHLLTQVEPVNLFDDEEGAWIWREHLKHPVSEELGLILDKMIESAIKRRYQSARDILTDLNAKLSSSDVGRLGSDNLDKLGCENFERVGSGDLGKLASETLALPLRNQSQNWQCVKTLIGHTWVVYSVAITPDGKKIVSGSEDETIKIWNLETGELEKTLKGHTKEVRTIALSHDNKNIVSGGVDGRVYVWDVETGEKIADLLASKVLIRAVAVHPNNTVAVLIADARGGKTYNYLYLKFIKIDSQSLLSTSQPWDNNYRNPIVFTPSSQTLASGYGCKIAIWNMKTAKLIREIEGHSNNILSLVFTYDAQLLISGSEDNTIKIWEAATGNLIRTLEGHSGGVNSLAITSDNKILVSGSTDQTIKLWEIETGEEICTLTGHNGVVYSVAISPDNKTIVSGSQDGTIKIWRL